MNVISDEYVKLSSLIRRYLKLEVEYVKLTLAEKITLLAASMTVGIIVLALVCFTLFMLAFASVELFRLIMCPALAYVSTAGIFLLILILVMAFKEKLIVNPISRFLTRVLFDNPQNS